MKGTLVVARAGNNLRIKVPYWFIRCRTWREERGNLTKHASTPSRPRHQLSRSISELSSPIRLHRLHSNRSTKEKDGDVRPAMPQSSQPSNARLSIERVRSEGMTPNLTPDASRGTSIMVPAGEENHALLAAPPSTAAIAKALAAAPIPPAAREEMIRKERQDAEARERFGRSPHTETFNRTDPNSFC